MFLKWYLNSALNFYVGIHMWLFTRTDMSTALKAKKYKSSYAYLFSCSHDVNFLSNLSYLIWTFLTDFYCIYLNLISLPVGNFLSRNLIRNKNTKLIIFASTDDLTEKKWILSSSKRWLFSSFLHFVMSF